MTIEENMTSSQAKINDCSCLFRVLIGSLGLGASINSYKARPVEFFDQSVNHSSLILDLIIFVTFPVVHCNTGRLGGLSLTDCDVEKSERAVPHPGLNFVLSLRNLGLGLGRLRDQGPWTCSYGFPGFCIP